MRSFSITDIGMHRKMNQDDCFVSEEPVGNLPNLFIVADGMGGHNAGEYASRHTVETMVESARHAFRMQPQEILKDAIEEANDGSFLCGRACQARRNRSGSRKESSG